MFRTAGIICLSLLVSNGAGQTGTNPSVLPTIDQIIQTDKDLTKLTNTLIAAGFIGVISEKYNTTIFAPVNAAFDALDQKFLAKLLTPNWVRHLQNTLAFHASLPAVDRRLTTAYTDGMQLEMLNSEEVTVNISKNTGIITITSPITGGSDIIEADMLASNGVVNKVNSIFFPSWASRNIFSVGDLSADFSIFAEIVKLLGFTGEVAGDYTLLVPKNTAFHALGGEALDRLRNDTNALIHVLATHLISGVYPSGLLTNETLMSYGGHPIDVKVPSNAIMFGNANVVYADILAYNGIAYVIDALLHPDVLTELQSNFSSGMPSYMPSYMPSDNPSDNPSDMPSVEPSDMPSDMPSAVPSDTPSHMPSDTPSHIPSDTPSHMPSDTPSDMPSDTPSDMPLGMPSDVPSDMPSDTPSDAPSDVPSSPQSRLPKKRSKKPRKKSKKFRANF